MGKSDLSMPLLTVHELCYEYHREPLLRDISLTLEKGEILCLLGPSGSGKTTLLRIIAGLEPPLSGTISFFGEDITKVPAHRRQFGMMFQEYALFPHKSVGENILFGLDKKSFGMRDRQRRLAEMLELVDLGGFAERSTEELSGGERQRVALARSLAPGPQLLLLDEPLGSLDRRLRDSLAGKIRAILKHMGVSAILVTHDRTEAFGIGDRVAVLHDQQLQQLATPEAVYRTPRNSTVARFLGFRNFLAGRAENNGTFTTELGVWRPAGGTVAQATLLLIRPDAALLATTSTPNDPTYLCGTLVDRRFQGAHYAITLNTKTLTLYFELPLDPAPPPIGSEISLVLKPSGLIPLAA